MQYAVVSFPVHSIGSARVCLEGIARSRAVWSSNRLGDRSAICIGFEDSQSLQRVCSIFFTL